MSNNSPTNSEASMNSRMSNDYNTTLKDIAGIKDSSAIFSVIEAYFVDEASIDELILTNNVFDIRTEKGRQKVAWAIKNTVLSFIDEDHKELMRAIFTSDCPFQDKKFILLWQLCINNRLIREITSKIFIKTYYSGRASISKDDIIGYLREEMSVSESSIKEKNWAEETIYRIATKYLSLMTKLEFISTERVKSFKPIRLSTEAQVIFLYFAKVASPHSTDIYANELLPLLFIQTEDLHNRLKKLSLKGFFNINVNGAALNIEHTHSHQSICDVLYH
jgi:hypothetical protein